MSKRKTCCHKSKPFYAFIDVVWTKYCILRQFLDFYFHFSTKKTTELQVQVFLRINTWLFETCRRQYNWIKSLMKKSVHFVGSYYKCNILHGNYCSRWYLWLPLGSKHVSNSTTNEKTHTKLSMQRKKSHYRPGQALRVPGVWGCQISRQLAH